MNTQTTPFTVAGIGDMSGDVFGNGMPAVEQTPARAASTTAIFIDPNPTRRHRLPSANALQLLTFQLG